MLKDWLHAAIGATLMAMFLIMFFGSLAIIFGV